jgi:hypothetical protein
MLVPLAGALEGGLVGLGLSLLVDVVLFGNSGFLFIFLFTLAGALTGLIAGYFLAGFIQEDPTTILVAQLAAAVIVGVVVLSFFVLARQSPPSRILLLAAVWGSFPGGVVGMFLTTTKRAPVQSQLDRRPVPAHMPTLAGGPGPATSKDPHLRGLAVSTPQFEFAPLPRMRRDNLLGRLQQEIGVLRTTGDIEPKVMALSGEHAGSVCVVLRLTNTGGSHFRLYVTCASDYPDSAPQVMMSELDVRSGAETETPFRSQLARFWNPSRGMKDLLDEAVRAIR